MVIIYQHQSIKIKKAGNVMEDKLLALVKENTINKTYTKNNATELGHHLNLSRNWISQHLNEFYSNETFIKINTRPVIFLDRKTLEQEYRIQLSTNLFSSYQDLMLELKRNEKKDFQKLIGHCESLQDLVDKCKASISYPPFGLPTLLHGPTGSGKSFIVYLMYEYGVNNHHIEKDAKFIHVNCSEYANNPELLSANLFGYKKGAFTGAESDNIGLIKAAEGGVLFLDEVHCLKPDCQEKLFLFMDNGYYRMLGDNENLYHSDVRLLFATTEDPQKVLLKTLYRRIPIRLLVPSIAERGINEKAQLIIHCLDSEAHKMKREIKITNIAYSILLNATYNGNVGELKNTIQATCMNALYHHRHEDNELQIHTLDLPETIISNSKIEQSVSLIDRQQIFSIQDLEERVLSKTLQNSLIDDLLQNMMKLQNNQISMNVFLQNNITDIENYYNHILFNQNANDNMRDGLILNMMKKIIEMIGIKYGLDFKSNEILALSMLVKDFSKHSLAIIDSFETYRQESIDFSKIIEKKYMREYSIASEMAQNIHVSLDLELNIFQIAILTLSMVIYHSEREINKRIGVILAHGYATASSIANAANQLLDAYIFDAIDMPIDTSTEVIIEKLNEYLNKHGDYQDLVLLVDMGSLEEIHQGIVHKTNANIAIANNVSTKQAVYIGDGLRNDIPLSKLFDECMKENINHYKIIEKTEKEKIILCSCATGIGTAEKLKSILEDSLPKALPVKVVTYDYSTLLEYKLENDFFNNYKVICIVGTLNPKIENIKFIPVEELIMNNSFEILTVYFKDMINENDMELFRRNILKNFSLSNIIGNLTILNPDKLLEHVADAIDKLQSEMNTIFSYNACFGLYVHICCLIERLVTHEGEEEYQKTADECTDDMQEFIKHIKTSFSKVEKYYSVNIPIEEMEYINIYIKNIQ